MGLAELNFDPFEDEADTLVPIDFDPFPADRVEPSPMDEMGLSGSTAPEPDSGLVPLSYDPFAEPVTVGEVAQNVAEFGKGVPSGAVSLGGAAIKGAAAFAGVSPRAAAYLAEFEHAASYPPEQIADLRRRIMRDALSPADKAWAQGALSRVLGGEAAADLRSEIAPVKDRSLYQAGETIEQFGRGILPPKPGYEQSAGRQLGEGLGSMLGAAGLTLLNPLVGYSTFTLAGAGEAIDRAIKEGASEADILSAARLGLIPGLTDAAPIETLLKGGIGIRNVGAVLASVGKIAAQAGIEFVQEGTQKVLQNLIAREVYKPTQDLTEGVLPEAAVGAGVGAIAEGGRQALVGAFGRRGRTLPPGERERATVETPPVTPEDEASPIPTELIAEGKKLMGDGDATTRANEILRAHNLPEVGARVTVDRGAGPVAGEVVDAFTAENAELGLKDDGIKIALDDGTTFEEFVDTIAASRVRILPEAAPGAGPGVVAPTAVQPSYTTTGAPTPEGTEDAAGTARAVTDPGAQALDQPQTAMSQSEGALLPQLRRPGGPGVPGVAGELPGVPGVGREAAEQEPHAGKAGQQRPLRAGQRPVGDAEGTGAEPAKEPGADLRGPQPDPDRLGGGDRPRAVDAAIPPEAGRVVDRPGAIDAAPGRQAAAALDPNAGRDGSRERPIVADTAESVAAAGERVEPDPSEAQIESGVYRKGHLKWEGLDLSIENPKGSERRGVDKGGKPWSVTLPADYGYIRRTEGADGDQVDFYMGPSPESRQVYVVDQVDAETGRFDEQKIMMGFASRQAALDAYVAGFSDGRGRDRLGAATFLTADGFKRWLREGDTTKPLGAIKPSREKADDRQGREGVPGPVEVRPQPVAGQPVEEGGAAPAVPGGAVPEEGEAARPPERVEAPKVATSRLEFRRALNTDYAVTHNGTTWRIDTARGGRTYVVKRTDPDGSTVTYGTGGPGPYGKLSRNEAVQHAFDKAFPEPDPAAATPAPARPKKPVTPQVPTGAAGATPLGRPPAEPPGTAPPAAPKPAPEIAPEIPPAYGASNTVFTQSAADKARETLRKKLGQLNVGIDPEVMQAGMTLAGYYIEAGARKFADFARAMIADLGEGIRPYLRSFYESVRHYPGFDSAGMSTAAEADAAEQPLSAAGAAAGEAARNINFEGGHDYRGTAVGSVDRGVAFALEASGGVGEERQGRDRPGRDPLRGDVREGRDRADGEGGDPGGQGGGVAEDAPPVADTERATDEADSALGGGTWFSQEPFAPTGEPHAAARAWVLARQFIDGFEHIAAIDGDGSVITAGTSSLSSRVNFTRATHDAMHNPTLGAVVHHNHPRGGPLSRGDLLNFSYPGLRWMVAHGDSSFSAMRLTERFASAMFQAHGRRYSGSARYDDITRLIIEADIAAYVPVTRQAEPGTVAAIVAEIRNRALAEAGVADYVTSTDIPAWAERLIPAVVDRVRRLAQTAVNYEASNDNRGTVRVRPDQGVARLLEGDGGDRQRDREGDGEDRPQRDRDEGEGGPPGVAFFEEPAPTPRVTFDDAITEARWQEARKGVGDGATLLRRTRDWLDYIRQGFSRHWIDLPNAPRFSDVQQQLRKLEAAPNASKEQVVRILRRMTEGMTAQDLDLFTRKVVLDDLMWEIEQEHALPFGFTDESARSELAKVDRALAGRPDLSAKVRQRKLIVRDVADRLVAAGVLHRDQIRNPAYYRHQVLDYARAMVQFAKGPGRQVKTPHWARRMGSTLDINANLLEAEFDWLHKALTDIATADTLAWIQDSGHNVRGRIIAAARAHNDKGVKALLDAEGDDGPLHDTMAGFKQRIGMGLAGVRKAIEDGSLDVSDEYLRTADALVAETADDGLFPFLAWILDGDKPGAMGAATVFKAISARKAFVKDLMGRDYADTRNVGDLVKRGMAPEGFVAWQPDKGNLLYTAKTLPEHVIDRMLDRIAAGGEFGAGEIRESVRSVLMVGGPKYEMVLPAELAATLDSFRDPQAEGLFEAVLEAPLRWWKRWVLINPRRVLKYNLNNLSGDIDAVIAGNPRALKHMGRAISEIHKVMIKGSAPSARYQEAVARGVFDSGLTVQEIPDINALDQFRHLIEKPGVARRFTLSPLMAVWRGLQRYTQFRENWLRYAAYLDYVERLEGGESLASIGYGASRREMVEAVADPKDRAALMARDLVGDYGAISHFGEWLRRKLIPFWSWSEINLGRYWRLGANAYAQGIGEGLRASGVIGAALGVRTTAYLALRMAVLYGMVQIWNNLFFGDDEDEMRTEERVRLHINLGRDDTGAVRTLRFQGAFSDMLSWVGWEEAVATLSDIEKGRAGFDELLGDIAKAPIKKVASGLTPVIQAPVEAATGKKVFWPDVFRPRAIKDPWRNLFQTFSLEHEYDLIFDRPSRGYARSAGEAVVSRRDAGENAYHRARSLAFDWLRREKGQEGVSVSTPRADALHDWRLAKRYGDREGAQAARQRLRDLGVTIDDLRASVKRAHPLGSIAIRERGLFLSTLDARERDLLQRAISWYHEAYLSE